MVSERPRWRGLLVGLAIAAGCAGGSHTRDASPAQAPAADDALLDDLERRTFDFFWSTADPTTGLVPDRAPTPSFSSIAAVGFGLTAYPIGVARG